jgi:metallophosphoesterase (TIGR00282 family)
LRILFVGDIMGEPGRRTVRRLLPDLIERHGIDLTVANGENASGGMGMTVKVVEELLAAGADVITSGNHIWKQKEMVTAIASQPKVLRPANYPESAPGVGEGVFTARDGTEVGVLNLCGTTFMECLDNPFPLAQKAADRLRGRTPVVVVDFHAEATSEKQAMGFLLDGQVSAVIGTHTHVQTADEEVRPGGTAYLTDVGMTGPRHSVIGMSPDVIIERFVTRMPARFRVAGGETMLCGAVVEIDEETGRARHIFRLQEAMDDEH